MSSDQVLKNPPIREAMMHVGFVSPSGLNSIQAISSFGDTLKHIFPEKKEQITFSLAFEPDTKNKLEEPPMPKSLITGFVFSSEDKKESVVSTRNDLTFSRLRPYNGWNEFAERFKIIFDSLKQQIPDLLIRNISLRYINRLDFDITAEFKLNDFFNLFPNIPKELNGKFEKYFLQLQLPEDVNNLSSVLTQTFKYCETNKELIHFHLDINVQKDVEGELDIWKTFEQMRDKKNDVFFNSLTKETIQKYI